MALPCSSSRFALASKSGGSFRRRFFAALLGNRGAARSASYCTRPSICQEEENRDHSHVRDDDSKTKEETLDVKTSILKAALAFVPTLGWTRHAVAAGADSLGLSAAAHGIFPSGGADLISFFYQSCNEELEHYLKEIQQSQHQVRGGNSVTFIRDAVSRRVFMIEPYRDTWPQAIGIMAMPTNAPTALSNLGDLMNIICYYAGDRSVDMSWYTKRLALAVLYKSTELAFIQDQSPGYSQTLDFLDKRVKDFAAFQECTAQIRQANVTARDMVEVGFATVKNMLGMNTL